MDRKAIIIVKGKDKRIIKIITLITALIMILKAIIKVKCKQFNCQKVNS